ncbi:prosaposin isoform X1 [Nematostella vectensis]|uniref:prosaposin isoform X1 n=1 Tax=Nematostella vectensis TaxID=45351 RepID=UPI002076F5AD|nr:prosaposin isoform X1 [Nematostella vectensis]
MGPKFLLLAAIIGSVCLSSVNAKTKFLLGSKKCTWGPSYWCQGMAQAVECDAVKHCQEKVWKNSIKEKNSFPCDTCKEVIGKIKKFAEDESLQDKIIQTMDKACSLLPSELSAKCKEVMGEAIKKLFASLDSIVKDPAALCKKLKLCSAQSKGEILKAVIKHLLSKDQQVSSLLMPGPVMMVPSRKPVHKLMIKTSETCVMCEFVMRELSKMLNENSTKEEIETALNKLCSYMPGSIQSECKTFVQEYTPFIIEILSKEFKPELVCRELKLCSAGGAAYLAVAKLLKPRLTANKGCDVCQTVVKDVQSALKDDVTVKGIEDMLSMICDYIPEVEIKKQCSVAIQHYVPELIDFFIKQDPKTICKDLDMCSSKL